MPHYCSDVVTPFSTENSGNTKKTAYMLCAFKERTTESMSFDN